MFKVSYDFSIDGEHINGVSNVYAIRDKNELGNYVNQFLIYLSTDTNKKWTWVCADNCSPTSEDEELFCNIIKINNLPRRNKENIRGKYKKI